MIIRTIFGNIFSFGQQAEFNMIPNNRYRTFTKHIYENADKFGVLRLASVYGANGAGKSNLIKAVNLLRRMIITENVQMWQHRHKFLPETSHQVMAIEFFTGDIPFLYAIDTFKNVVYEEELYISGLDRKEDELVFSRKRNEDGSVSYKLPQELENKPEGNVLKSVIEQSLSKDQKLSLSMLADLKRPELQPVVDCLKWFKQNLTIISPDSKPLTLAENISEDEPFRCFANSLLRSLSTGVDEVFVINTPIDEHKDLSSELLEKLKTNFSNRPQKSRSIALVRGKDTLFIQNEKGIFTQEIKSRHHSVDDKPVEFNLNEESDGTLRLLDLLPLYRGLLNSDKVYLVDELERSIHPVLIKELLRKLSTESDIKGQLIFTTHEANLLDQDIFRKDEIWFAEKRKDGSTDFYSLSDFKEHHSIDISKGYLTGRYGAIPFMGNLKALNWEEE